MEFKKFKSKNTIIYDDKAWSLGAYNYYHNRVYGRLHRYIWEQANGEISDGMVIHHIDFNKFNNALENLQIMSLQEHSSIHGKAGNHPKGNIRKGYCFNKPRNKWMVQIFINDKNVNFGRYSTEEEAILCVDIARGIDNNLKGIGV